MPKISVIIPCRNEEENLPELLLRLDRTMKSASISYEAIVVDDYSTDRTSEVARSLAKKYPIKLIRKQGMAGKAFAVLEGASASKSEFLALIDADLQYPPELLPKMLEIAMEKGVAVGNRTKRHTSFARKLVSKTYKYLFGKFLMGMNVDVQSGIKVFRREIITHLREHDVTAWTLDMPLLHTARELGYEVGSVDMEFLERKNGQSKVKIFKTSAEIGLKALKLRFSRRKIYKIEPIEKGMVGAGVAYKRKRYITHTTLSHTNSALVTITGGQKVFLALLLGVALVLIFNNPFAVILAFVAILSFVYFLDVLFSGFVLLKSLHFPPELNFSDEQLQSLNDSELPTYSVLCPLYKEARILPHFIEAMEALHWPKKRLEVLLLLEENDRETINAAKSIRLPSHFKIVIVPNSFPKTKPKACNYGLSVARGEYVVVYDAEDKPDPLQLKKVYLAFLKLGKRYGCVQCKLNYFNSTYNILTRLFTAEYSLWFDVILPGLQSIEGSIPLGGTSNHFRRADLVALHAWDPFNVTEDCDLGIRLFKNGYKTAIVDSVTLEEANSKVKNWIRQRSRWIKGYFQTYLVHMRNPIKFFREQGIHALIFQLVIGMRMTFMLINPILWAVTVAYFAAYKLVGPTIEALFPPLVFYMAGFALIIGNFMYIYNYMIGAAKRGHWGLIKFVFLVPFYWLLTSIAAVLAFWQLITKPHYWEKTQHGLHLKPSPKSQKELFENVASEIVEPARSQFAIPTWIGRFAQTGTLAGIFLIFASFAGNFFNFLYNAYLGRELSPEVFGVIGLIGSFLSLSQIIMSGLSRTVTYKSAYLLGKHNKTVKEFWSKVRWRWVWISYAISLIWILLTPLLMRMFNSTDPVPFVLFAPVWIVGILASIDTGFLSGNLKFGIIALTTLVEAASKFVIAYVFVEFGKANLVYAAVPLSMTVSFFISWLCVLLMKSTPAVRGFSRDLAFPKRFFATSILTKISSVTLLSIDVLMAKLYLSPRDAGLYTLLSLIGSVIFFTGTLFAQFITPLVSRAEGASKDSKTVFRQLLLATTFASFGAFVIFGMFGVITAPFLFGSKALSILPFLSVYTGAMVFTTVSVNIVSYHQIKHHNLFPVVGFLISIFQIIGIARFHTSLVDIVSVVVVVNTAYLVLISLLHVFYSQVVVLLKNFIDFLGLFGTIPESRRSLQNGKLRILVLNWRDNKHKWAGGAEIYVQEIAKRWVKDGNQVTVFCGNDGKNLRHETVDGVRVVRRGGFYTVYIWAFLYYVLRFRGQFDAVVDHENGVPFFTPLYVNVPKFLLIFHVHQEVFRENLKFPLSQIAMFIERRVMPLVYRSAKVITISRSSKKDIVKLGCSSESDIDVITPGVDLSVYEPSRKTLNPTFVFVGRLKAYKNIDIAIRSFAKALVKYPKARFYVAGEGDMDKRLAKLVGVLNIGASVVFKGKVTEEEKIALLGKSWVALQPSSFEGWGLTVIEANACGTPVIASNTNGLKDSVLDGKTGILVPVRDVNILAREMVELIRDKEYRRELSKNAYTWAQKFSWDESASKFYGAVSSEINNIEISPELAKENI